MWHEALDWVLDRLLRRPARGSEGRARQVLRRSCQAFVLGLVGTHSLRWLDAHLAGSSQLKSHLVPPAIVALLALIVVSPTTPRSTGCGN